MQSYIKNLIKLLDYSQIAICRLHSKKWSSKLVFRNFWMRLLQGVTLCDAKITMTNSYKNSLNCFFFINLWQYIKKFNSNNLLICAWFSQALAALKTDVWQFLAGRGWHSLHQKWSQYFLLLHAAKHEEKLQLPPNQAKIFQGSLLPFPGSSSNSLTFFKKTQFLTFLGHHQVMYGSHISIWKKS